MKKPTSFKNKDLKLAAELHLPDNFTESQKYPAIVCIHPAGGVKEQTIGLYASRLADCGFVVLTFDASYQGASEGEPRYLEEPTARVEDARAGADYLSTLSYIDMNRVGVFGICAGGGYAISVAQTEHRFKAVATVSAAPMGEGFRNFLGIETPIPTLLDMLKKTGEQRSAEANGAEPLYMHWVPETKEVINENTPDLWREGHDYYKTPRGQHANSVNKYLFSSTDRMIAFSAFDQISTLLTQPMLLIAGSKADTKLFSDQAYKLAKGQKELFVVDGATHISMYDTPEYVDQAIGKLNEFYDQYL
ncbi:alpha/beta hydrolase [Mucilaginibacter sp. KACC 22773]|uniref:alpha/beta hydrolase n=1 Tax=Mucilaginibacter sp. KACC 22773 TaxID=3025671 RepID=UPI002366FB8F|nr:alpha/beta hydrolase [Mucilaginibacter sp. KACC 22773]WDF81148.1 alpha/beta hydrolase [Mucilaginibacter sp. KACC 22773]